MSEPLRNDLRLVGAGTLEVDGVSVSLTGKCGSRAQLIQPLVDIQLPCWRIANVEAQGSVVRLYYSSADRDDGAITLRLADDTKAEQLVTLLPKVKTRDSKSQLIANAEFARRLVAQPPHTPVTFGLIAINLLVFIATLLGGAHWIAPRGGALIAWGSNFGPYTTHGEWWRPLTSIFIHFGIVHRLANMLAMAMLGPTIERLYGSVNYFLIYVFSRISGGLASLFWHPNVNSAGASGAMFGIIGALLAAILTVGDDFPTDIKRPLQHWVLLFFCWTLYPRRSRSLLQANSGAPRSIPRGEVAQGQPRALNAGHRQSAQGS